MVKPFFIHTLSLAIGSVVLSSALYGSIVYSTGAPQIETSSLGTNYYADQSVFGTYFYNTPNNTGNYDYNALADYFTLTQSAGITSIGFWGFLQDYGSKQSEIHFKVMAVDPNTGLPTGTAFTADSAMMAYSGYDAFVVASPDPPNSPFTKWRWNLSSLTVKGSAQLTPGVYALMIASDDNGSEFYWGTNPPNGLSGGVFDNHLQALNNDGVNWMLQSYAPLSSKLAFELASGAPTLTLSGTIKLDFLVPSKVAGQIAHVQLLKPVTHVIVQAGDVTLDSSGAYSFNVTTPGTYDVRARGSHWLSQTLTGVNLSGSQTVNFNGPSGNGLLNGDTNGDNVIDDFDLTNVILDFASTPNAHGHSDLNEDGIVDDFDLTEVILNFGAVGS